MKLLVNLDIDFGKMAEHRKKINVGLDKMIEDVRYWEDRLQQVHPLEGQVEELGYTLSIRYIDKRYKICVLVPRDDGTKFWRPWVNADSMTKLKSYDTIPKLLKSAEKILREFANGFKDI